MEGLQTRPDAATNRLRRVDLEGVLRARPLIAGDPTGVTLGPFSPDGRRVAVYGLRGGQWRLGVASLADGRVRWFPVAPEFPYRERTVQWLSPDRLVAIARPDRRLPLVLRIDAEGPLELPGRWRRAAAGEAVVTVVGSGRHFGLRPQAPPNRLVVLDVRSGRARTLARGGLEDLEVSPDARRLAFVERGPDIRLAADRPVQGAYGVAGHRERLGLVDLATGQVLRPLPGEDLAGQLLSWSPSGRRLLVFARPDGAPWRDGRLLQVDPEGRAQALAPGPYDAELTLRPEVPRAVWLGETPAVLARRDGRLDWIVLAAGRPVALTAAFAQVPAALQPVGDGALGVAQGRAWRLTAAGAVALDGPDGLRPAAPRSVQFEQRLFANPPAAAAVGLALRDRAGGSSLVLLGPPGPVLEIPLPGPSSGVAAVDPVRRQAAALDADPHGVERLRVWAGGRWTVVDTVNARQADVDPLAGLPVRHRAPGGEPIESWLYRPAARPGAPPPPLIVVPYPGQSFHRPAGLADYNHDYLTPSVPALVGAGYAVLTPSLPLAADAEPAVGLAARVLAIVDAAAAQHPGVFDPARLGLWGHSFGGYGVMAILAQTDRFAAAVETGGPSNLTSIWGTFQVARRIDPADGLGVPGTAGWTEDAQARMGAPPWRDPGRYLRNSPLFQADRIRTPLLLVTADQDHIPMSQAEEMFAALYRQDRDAVLLTYWGESHILYAPGPVRDLYRRALAWLGGYLARPVSGDAAPQRRPGPAPATSAPRSP